MSPARRRLFWLLAGLAAALGVAAALLPGGDGEVWFDDLAGIRPLACGADEWMRLAEYAARRLLDANRPPPALPDPLARDAAPRIVFLSLGGPDAPAAVALGSGRGVAAAIEDAVARLVARGHRAGASWLKLDLVESVDAHGWKRLRDVRVDRSLAGLAFGRAARLAFLPEELVSRTLVTRAQHVQLENLSAYVARHRPGARPVGELRPTDRREVFVFTTRSAFHDGRRGAALYRGHRTWAEATPEDLLASARAAGDYLRRAVLPDGRLVQDYLPKKNEVRRRDRLVCHAAGLRAMVEVYEAAPDDRLLAAARRAIAYLVAQARPVAAAGESEALALVEDGAMDGGAAALAVVVLARYAAVTRDRRYDPQMLRLAAGLRATQAADGGFPVHVRSWPDGRVDTRLVSSQDLPGLATLAMVCAFARDGGEAWLDAAERAARHLVAVRDARERITSRQRDPWLLTALVSLHRRRPDERYLRHAERIARAILHLQVRRAVYPDWVGSYSQPPLSLPAGRNGEALIACHRLLSEFGGSQQAALAGEALRGVGRGVRFQLQTQFRPEQVMYLLEPGRCLGGFHSGLTGYRLRLACIQHNVCSILAYRRVLLAAAIRRAVPPAGDQSRQGSLMLRPSQRFASSSPGNSSLTGSHFSGRLSQ